MMNQRAGGAAISPAIRLNTVGYLPDHWKKASIAGACTQFSVHAEKGATVFSGKVTGPLLNPDTQEQLFTADFSSLKKPGRYYLEVPGIGRSPLFVIAKDAYNAAFYTVMRGMYLWRCGVAVSGKHNGSVFTHAACHTGDGYLDFVGGGHTRKDGSGGWHDAGDYNKYVVNAGITVGMMLLAWDQFRDRLQNIPLHLPESGNGIPDYLNEIKFEIEWLLKMQAADGSVHHKLSTQRFGGFVLPERESEPRFFTPWSSAATADFVAMTAQMARAIKPYDAAFAHRCLEAARKSYQFLAANPADHKANLNGFSTGAYQTNDSDDRLWAAAEMWETTGEPLYLKDFETNARTARFEANFDWGNVANLGLVTYLLSKHTGKDTALMRSLHDALLATANGLVQERDRHGYARPLGNAYYWGCNGTVARQTLILLSAHRIVPRKEYVETSLDALHHLLGRNYYGRSFVTGIGERPPLYPHDRRAGGDTVADPWPGYLVGGGWPGATDWKDEQGSYQTNEIAINWNGALIYALAAFVAPKSNHG